MTTILSPAPTFTGRDLIEGALRLLSVLSPDVTLTDAEVTDGLYVANQLLESWALDGLTLYQVMKDDFTTTAGHNPHTYGISGDWSQERPIRILQATARIGGVDKALKIIGYDDYAMIRLKTLSTYPEYLYADGAYPASNIYLYPVPGSALPVTLWVERPLIRLYASTDEVALPPGYFRALRYGLALELAPEYQVSAGPDVMRIASSAKRNLKAANSRTPTLQAPVELQSPQGGRYNIFTDGVR